MATASAIISVKTDPSIKKKAHIVAKQLGISLSGIINAYLRQLVQKKEIHFKCHEEIPNKKTAQVLHEIDKDILESKNIGKVYNSKNILEAFNS